MVVTSRAKAEFGGAVRLDYGPTSGDCRVHPDLYRLTSITCGVGQIIDVVLPGEVIIHLRTGFELLAINRSIGGTGNLRLKIADGPRYWDFVAAEWIETPNTDCLILPGEIAEVHFYGFRPFGEDSPDASSTPSAPTDETLYWCRKKTAVPSPFTV
jgi:hypothetical protein